MITSEVKLFEAIKMMRQLTKIGVPFSFEYKSFDSTRGQTDGVKVIEKALLRPGLRTDQSDLAESLIGYIVYPSGLPRFFHVELLLRFNGKKVIP
ncbi:hypothetical protein [Flavobacterium sp. NKUCC04_CG]|uniref:hypothetical protein n=1 Tax=Flavobacterium sp. NKUCC04_CG TaxID=2842121 RepID=UPI001C5B431B|nr:hypothetical protein [Flavobacterium sp. NKUCC04_CG]MBW3519500.1 hypothetical protein [Flavobacterium sp. NKUCC04_CG]